MSISFDPQAVESFHYVGYEVEPSGDRIVLRCHYRFEGPNIADLPEDYGDLAFEEVISFEVPPSAGVEGGVDVSSPRVQAAFRLVHLLAGVSYYKAAAPLKIDVGNGGLTPAERRLLTAVYREGLGEYAYRNQIDLSGLVIAGPDREPVADAANAAVPDTLNRPLIPFGGGLDSIVTVEGLRDKVTEPALFVVSREGDRFDAIETAIEVTGLPVVRAGRQLDEKILRSRDLGFRNGHIPVTGIISSIAVTAALLSGRDSVVMSNEWSASSGNTQWGDLTVNHQWSKTLEFEDMFRAALNEAIEETPQYYSWLRCFSELWVAKRFIDLDQYHLKFRSCNRAFHIDRALRHDRWCGECDKCAFIDLILSPFLPAERLKAVFDGNEPLANPDMLEKMRTLAGLSGDIKPFECVGDVDECRVALLMAAARPDRAGEPLLAGLAAEVAAIAPGDVETFANKLLVPLGEQRVPQAHAPDDLLV